MGAQHSPGPWHVVRYGDGDSLVICLDETGNHRVAFLATPGCRDHQERRKVWRRIKANARLIAESPAMLAALRKAERFLAGFEGDTDVLDVPIDDDLAEIRAIVARVDGNSGQ